MLIGKKVILEEIDFNNIEQLRLWRNDPSLRKYFREWKDITVDKQKIWYNNAGNNSNQNHVYFQIMERDKFALNKKSQINNRSLIGCCGLHYINWQLRSAEFGIFLGEGRGKGMGKESLCMLVDYGFKEMNLHKIWAEVYDNNNSIHLYHKIGFMDEGILRDNYFSEGKYGNSIVMSVLEQEWRERWGDKVLWEIK